MKKINLIQVSIFKMKSLIILNQKIKKHLWSITVSFAREKNYYYKIYYSYWNYQFYNFKKKSKENSYYTAIPNNGAGIGHQLANWIAGYWFAKQFGLKFAHSPFSSKMWDAFLGFGENEILVNDLIQNQKYKRVLLPLFNENNEHEFNLIKKIINSYANKKVVFVAEQDQFYKNQFGNIEKLQHKFYSAKARKEDVLIYKKEYFNIAIHVRRGDIVIGQKNKNPNLQMRWQDNNYFEKVLTRVLATLKSAKPIQIYLFSQGERKDFTEFEKFKNMHFCLEMNAQDSFLHMVYADLLITSKSSFSYKPALLSNGIKICPKDFWHGYPKDQYWILADNEGNFREDNLKAYYA